MEILGSDGVKMLWDDAERQLQLHPSNHRVEISIQRLRELVGYYYKLVQVCDHEWDYGSPIDAGLCIKCGKLGE